MATINWPTGLRPSLKASKSRDEVIGFRESPPSVGPSFVEPFSDDTPVFYDISLTFSKSEARAFQSWLRLHKMKTNAPFFNFPLVIEDPNVANQEARFLLDGYPQLTGETNYTFSYSARILIRKIVTQDEAYDEFLLQLGELTGFRTDEWTSDFDLVLNTARVIS